MELMEKKERDALYRSYQEYLEACDVHNAKHGIVSAADYWDERISVLGYGKNLCITEVETGRSYTYDQIDRWSDHFSSVAIKLSKEKNLHKGTNVALLMRNCAEFIATWLGFSKVGMPVALINTLSTAGSIAHSLMLTKAAVVVVDVRYRKAFDEALKLIDFEPSSIKYSDIHSPTDEMLAFSDKDLKQNQQTLRKHVTRDDPLFYIFTSGTTGMPKAANFSHRRFYGAGQSWFFPMKLTSKDIYYIFLPIFHGNGGVVAVSACFKSGCQIILQEKFHAKSFWKTVDKYKITSWCYIGEIMRYLLNLPVCAEEKKHNVRVICGNGINSEVWKGVVSRFKIPLIVEHYGLTEMPAGPYLNFYGKPGACGYIPPDVRAKTHNDTLLEYDTDSGRIKRGKDGFCIEVKESNHPGEAIFRLLAPYRGYLSKKKTEERIYRDVFEKGDSWFCTGDLLRLDSDGFFYFEDRLGDTFRWKGENVSTTEVSSIISTFEGISETNSYGVTFPNHGGKCGMVSIRLDIPLNSFSFEKFGRFLRDNLAGHAIPLFYRFTEFNLQTATYKFRKSDYVKEGYSLDVKDAVYFFNPKILKFSLRDEALLKKINDPLFRI